MIDFVKLAADMKALREAKASPNQEVAVALKTKPAKGGGKSQEKFDDTNRGVLFPNDKGENENRPDYTGKINVDGVEKRLAAWVKTSEKIGEYLSISVSDPQES